MMQKAPGAARNHNRPSTAKQQTESRNISRDDAKAVKDQTVSPKLEIRSSKQYQMIRNKNSKVPNEIASDFLFGI